MNPPTSKYTNQDTQWATQQLALIFICLLACVIGPYDLISWLIDISNAPSNVEISIIPALQGVASILIALLALNLFMFRSKKHFRRTNGDKTNG